MVEVNWNGCRPEEKITSLQMRKKGLIATGTSWRSQKEMELFRQLPWGALELMSLCQKMETTSSPWFALIGLGSSLPGTSFPSLCLQLVTKALLPGQEVNLCLRCLV